MFQFICQNSVECINSIQWQFLGEKTNVWSWERAKKNFPWETKGTRLLKLSLTLSALKRCCCRSTPGASQSSQAKEARLVAETMDPTSNHFPGWMKGLWAVINDWKLIICYMSAKAFWYSLSGPLDLIAQQTHPPTVPREPGAGGGINSMPFSAACHRVACSIHIPTPASQTDQTCVEPQAWHLSSDDQALPCQKECLVYS